MHNVPLLQKKNVFKLNVFESTFSYENYFVNKIKFDENFQIYSLNNTVLYI